jgi:hypothetical protein
VAGILDEVIVQDVVPPVLLIGGIALVGFVVYKYLTSKFGGSGSTSTGATNDPTKNTSVLDSTLNGVLTVGPGTETYTSAFGQTVAHPLSAIESILGFNAAQ